MSIAYGYASGSRQDNDIDKVHQTADDRMYEKKKQMKSRSANGCEIVALQNNSTK